MADESGSGRTGWRGGAWLMVLVLAGAGAIGYRTWSEPSRAAVPAGPAASQPVSLRVATARRLSDTLELTQTGTTQAFDTANLYSRATGYIAERRIDIGSRVRKGDLLFRISAPDLDQQLAQAQSQVVQLQAALAQAKAMVDQAEANRHLADVNNKRTSTLVTTGATTAQNADSAQAGVLTQAANLAAAKAMVKVAEANVAAQEAQVGRLTVLTGFEEIRAPFDGVVTARSVDRGDAVTADTNSGTPLATLVRDDVLRMAVNVPLYAADGVRDGLPARITVAQIPGKVFPGTVSRSSAALLYASRTLVTQVDIPNPTRDLQPGFYITVTLSIPRPAPVVSVPNDALIFDQTGTRVAVLEPSGVGEGFVVRLRPVAIERQLDTALDLRAGLVGGEQVVIGPPASLRDGDAAVPRKPAKAGT